MSAVDAIPASWQVRRALRSGLVTVLGILTGGTALSIGNALPSDMEGWRMLALSVAGALLTQAGLALDPRHTQFGRGASL